MNSADVIRKLGRVVSPILSAPSFSSAVSDKSRVVLGVSSMKDHMTDEGWQITNGLSKNGYIHCGYGLEDPETDVGEILRKHDPQTVVIQDIREWDVRNGDFRDANARFTNFESISKNENIFRVTVLKDAQQNPPYHRQTSDHMGIHAWIVYYNKKIVKHVAPYVREEHLIRTTHSIDDSIVPEFSGSRNNGCLFSGAVSNAYPLRQWIMAKRKYLPVHVHKHPGYHRNGSDVPAFMEMLNTFKVSICTSSRYGYLLRKIIESTACGCRVITDLPEDERFPAIEENLIRIGSSPTIPLMRRLISEAVNGYDYSRQRELAAATIGHYGYLNVCKRLADDIESLRKAY